MKLLKIKISMTWPRVLKTQFESRAFDFPLNNYETCIAECLNVTWKEQTRCGLLKEDKKGNMWHRRENSCGSRPPDSPASSGDTDKIWQLQK